MPSKNKQTRLTQKTYWEEKLNRRLAVLSEKGVQEEKLEKDPAVKKIRAEIRAANARLKVIDRMEKKVEEMAEAKAQKEKGLKEKKGKKAKEAEDAQSVSKRQAKKQQKVKEKQKKKEQKDQQG